MKRTAAVVLWSCLVLCSAPSLFAQDKPGCKDLPILTRFPESVITKCVDNPDDTGRFHMGPGKPDKLIEGEYHYVAYRGPATASKPQIVRNLVTALKSAGYVFDYDSGTYGDSTSHMGKTWVSLSVSGTNYEVFTVTETALKQDVVATAAELKSGINATGHAAVYGIHFDTGKADIKPDSAAALDEIVKMLQENASLKVYVVGHTDNVGAVAANVELSKQRAASVVAALTRKGIAAARMQPYGAGPYAPVLTNDTEEGRALNRRVDFVKQ